MKLSRLEIENIKSIKCLAIDLSPEGAVITGKNGAGKTTTRNAIEILINGPDRKQRSIIRKGEAAGRIRGEFDDPNWIMERVVTEGKPDRVTLTTKEGAAFSSPMETLKSALGAQGIAILDPMAFNEKQPRDRRQVLCELAGIDADAYDSQIKEARDALKAFEADLAALKNRFQGSTAAYEGVPEEEISITDLSARLTDGQVHNAAIDRGNDVTEAKRRERTQQRATLERLNAEALALTGSIAALDKEIAEREAKAAEILPVDLETIRGEIETAEGVNRKVRHNLALAAARAEWEAKEPERAALERKVQDLEQSKRKALSEAKFPIAEIGFDEFDATYNGIPWSQASESEKLRGALALSLATKGNLEITTMDASALDGERRAEVRRQLAEAGVQAFLELDIDRAAGETGCVIEIVDGEGRSEGGE